MRRIANTAGGERGAVAVLVAVLMVVLLGFAAISIDVAKLYSERAQLQNGADAVALMVAQKCAKGTDDSNCSSNAPAAKALAGDNAVDGISNVISVDLDKSAGTVRVVTGAEEIGAGTNSVSLFFAGVLGFTSAEVSAASSARWGSPAKGRTPFPITVSICQVRGQTGVPQLLQLHGNNANPDCSYGPNGAPVPGGFGGLKENTSFCGADIDIEAASAGSNTGNDPPKHCDSALNGWAADMQAGKEVIMLLPIFDAVTGVGDNATYHFKTIAAFRVMGWKLGATGLPYTFRNRTPDVPAELQCFGSCRGIIGKFVEYLSLSDEFTLGPPTADGAKLVKLTQ
ncbi:pilus assembly protein TadG-related protein [Pseudarthrobacter sp. NamB4]|uniref:pilus assembly protein TadG-related protein n=1 Tax=Pseudarthrobacter sp. NamB4 TaxID=2576837 RepID=UPI0010FD03B0|nr:Tad domain-containing protein [Pseudarthrobacter sp. NamB4]TLM74708.1 pilus assembly protein TadG [Pseudarthrobacter sp. NamB4]